LFNNGKLPAISGEELRRREIEGTTFHKSSVTQRPH